MSAIVALGGRAPLLGHNLVRLLYLDEAGTNDADPFLCVAGVLVHGDNQWPEIDRRILGLIDQYIPEHDRIGFCFHATDIFHGSDYFDRRKPEWSDESKRMELLDDLARIIQDLALPVVFSPYNRAQLESAKPYVEIQKTKRSPAIQSLAIIDCLIRADAWLESSAPSELATVVHEDGTKVKPIIKRLTRTARSKDYMKSASLRGLTTESLPLKRIIDTVHFAEKADARPLQLADLCAFIITRVLKRSSFPQVATEIIMKQLHWIIESDLAKDKEKISMKINT
jgi:hypothetical protein